GEQPETQEIANMRKAFQAYAKLSNLLAMSPGLFLMLSQETRSQMAALNNQDTIFT
ncbi:unnamed protein product, partial [marine sediment metagenome]